MLRAGDVAPAIAGVEPGRALLVLFKVSCPTCQLTLPHLNKLTGAIRVIGVSQDSRALTDDFASKHGVQYPLVLDAAGPGYPASRAFGITHVPSLFLVNDEGVIEFASNGFVKADLVELGRRLGIEMFTGHDRVPEFKPG